MANDMNNRCDTMFVFVQDLVAVEFSSSCGLISSLISLILISPNALKVGHSSFKILVTSFPNTNSLLESGLLKTFIHAAILHDVRIYRVQMGNVENRDPQRPNVSKYVGSASNSFLCACFRSLFG